MPYDTDEKLKGFLDTNQLAREQMCLAILALDKRFSEVRPRHPRGGPDGGRDIEAMFHKTQRAFGAVGFINQADDSAEKKKRVNEKFHEDLAAALAATPKPEVFVFLTNVNLTIGEKDDLIAEARAAGAGYCEVFDRERLRIALDNTDGLAIRYQHLHIPLSETEQAAFFARWGDDIQSVISTGFQDLYRTLNRLLFLQESSDRLSAFNLVFELDRTYAAEEIGHFRAFCELHLMRSRHGIDSILFGAADKSDRMRDDIAANQKQMTPGIAAGICEGQWEELLASESETEEDGNEQDDGGEELVPAYKRVGCSSGVGINEVKFVSIEYRKEPLIRRESAITLRDLDESLFLARLNRGLAEKVSRVHVYGNEYKLLEMSKGDFVLDDGLRSSQIPVDFSETELSDPWVYIRPEASTFFHLRFSAQTPHRFFAPRETENSLQIPARA